MDLRRCAAEVHRDSTVALDRQRSQARQMIQICHGRGLVEEAFLDNDAVRTSPVVTRANQLKSMSILFEVEITAVELEFPTAP